MSLYDKDRGDEFRRNLDASRAPIVALARLLERAAFADRPEQSNHVRIKADPDGFEPAPLYIFQATALSSYPALREEIMESLRMMQRRH